ncbi:MAG: flagellar hook-length control protein FliK [Proteobacteria bacterium]|nr:flagellar hook-length control protein FliK [Pseudomonadota bacterium]
MSIAMSADGQSILLPMGAVAAANPGLPTTAAIVGDVGNDTPFDAALQACLAELPDAVGVLADDRADGQGASAEQSADETRSSVAQGAPVVLMALMSPSQAAPLVALSLATADVAVSEPAGITTTTVAGQPLALVLATGQGTPRPLPPMFRTASEQAAAPEEAVMPTVQPAPERPDVATARIAAPGAVLEKSASLAPTDGLDGLLSSTAQPVVAVGTSGIGQPISEQRGGAQEQLARPDAGPGEPTRSASPDGRSFMSIALPALVPGASGAGLPAPVGVDVDVASDATPGAVPGAIRRSASTDGLDGLRSGIARPAAAAGVSPFVPPVPERPSVIAMQVVAPGAVQEEIGHPSRTDEQPDWMSSSRAMPAAVAGVSAGAAAPAAMSGRSAAETGRSALVDGVDQPQPTAMPPIGSADPGSARSPDGALRLPNGDANQWRQPLMQALGERLQFASERGIDSAVIRLEPPRMGSIEIAIRHQDGALQINLSATHNEVLRQLQDISDNLRHNLGQRHSGDVTVQVADASASRPGQGQGDGERQRQRQAQAEQNPGRALGDAEAEAERQSFRLARNEE